MDKNKSGLYIVLIVLIVGITAIVTMFVQNSNNIITDTQDNLGMVIAGVSSSQTINLALGWNIISFNVNPTDKSLNSVFSSMTPEEGDTITDSTNGLTAVYTNGVWTGFDSIDLSSAYKIKVSRDKVLTVFGTVISDSTNIYLKKGTNYVPYYPTTELDAATTFQTIKDCLIKVQDERGKTYENFGAFGGWKNTIGMLKPGEGYVVTTNNACTLNYNPVITPTVTCSDSDDGANYFVKGKVIDSRYSTPFYDSCANINGDYESGAYSSTDTSSSDYLKEYTCKQNTGGMYYETNIIPCDYGCSDGACIKDFSKSKTYTPVCGDNIASVDEECDGSAIYNRGFVVLDLSKSGSNPTSKTVTIGGKEYVITLLGGNTATLSVIVKVNGESYSIDTSRTKTISGLNVHLIDVVMRSVNNVISVDATLELRDSAIEECSQLDSNLYTSGELACTSDCKYDTSSCDADVFSDCTDSDGGENYYMKGITNASNEVIIDRCCLSMGEGGADCREQGTVLIEGFCLTNDYAEDHMYNCPNGCSDGVCIQNTTPVVNKLCVDTESVTSNDVRGILSNQDNSPLEYDDAREDLSSSRNSDLSVHVLSSTTANIIFFGEEKIVKLGEIAYFDVLSIRLNSINFVGVGNVNNNVKLEIMTIKDFCDTKNTLYEYYCDADINADRIFNAKEINCPNGCSNGVCIQNTTVNVSICTDADNGLNYYTKGVAYGVASWGKDYPADYFVDYCFCEGPHASCNDLNEMACVNGYLTQNRYTCPNGCSDGVCIQNTTINMSLACTDSDNGRTYTNPGTVTYAGQVYDDYCSGSQLFEYVCENEFRSEDNIIMKGLWYDCPNGCSDGACIGNQTSGLTLANYPSPFIKDGVPNALFVVGRIASVDDIIGITDIIANLQRYAGNNPFPTGIVKFDDEITEEQLYNRNVILVGGMCANSATAKMYDNPEWCTSQDTPGVGKIKIIRNKSTDKYVLLVHGYSALETTMATRVLANWQDYKSVLETTDSVCVTGTLNSIIARSC